MTKRVSVNTQSRVGCWRSHTLTPLLLLMLSGTVAVSTSSRAAECLSHIEGEAILEISSCVRVEPIATLRNLESKHDWLLGLDDAARAKLLAEYRGLFLEGRVVSSTMRNVGTFPKDTRLPERIRVFVPPNLGFKCSQLKSPIRGVVEEKCCDGGASVPCLLGSSYAFRPGASGSSVATKVKVQSSVRKHYSEALRLREAGKCPEAIPLLKEIFTLVEQARVASEDRKVSAQASLLLARCYSVGQDPDAAVVTLQSFLLDPKRFRPEIEASINHKDFGWISTTQQYRKYLLKAKKAID